MSEEKKLTEHEKELLMVGGICFVTGFVFGLAALTIRIWIG